ncbi:MAG TPA: hypothetical protein VEC35_09585 [Noviherbaspirillum sp.]|nr:hypothetical protein [Noviherbaspirillum sp.]
MGNAQFRTTDEEETAIAARMALAGDRTRSDHFRRVYFQNVSERDVQIGEIKRQLEMLAEGQEHLRRAVQQLATAKSDDLELRLLAGLYALLYPSVDDSVQAKVDQHIDYSVVEHFLSGNTNKGKRK